AGLSRGRQHRLNGLPGADQPDAIAVRHRLIQGAALHIGLEKAGEPGLWQVHLFEEQWLLANAADPLEKYDPITRLELQRPCYGFVCSLRPGGDQPGVGIEPSTAHLLREAGER